MSRAQLGEQRRFLGCSSFTLFVVPSIYLLLARKHEAAVVEQAGDAQPAAPELADLVM